ncbi:MAG: TerD family protein [Flammeovirgaceae bacterium]|nr:TerD family protein [Flammeovirgaceae bacterium]
MSINLDKKTGINLKKGSSISLEKDGKKLQEVCVGLNWGSITTKSFFGLLKETENVDLDGSVTMFNSRKEPIETVYYHRLRSSDNAIVHSGDDRKGDDKGDDGQDNEVIQVYLHKVNPEVEQIVFYLNSYKGQDFSMIPYSKIRIFEGNPNEVKEVFATFNLSAEKSFEGQLAMVMGKLVRKGKDWEFKAIGEGHPTRKIEDTIKIIKEKYLD